jgi:RNA 2',3'-cyclic 3'-phosphodiesterase
MRLFVAIDIDSAIRERIARFVENVRGFAPAARWVTAESMHVTLKFIGEQPPQKAEEINRALSQVRGAPSTVRFGGTGFFPNPRSPRVFWVGIEADRSLGALAARIDEALAPLGVPGEERTFSPHLTLARGGDSHHPRGGSGSPRLLPTDKPNRGFSQLQTELAGLPQPEFGTMTATELVLYESKLSSSGAHYTRLAAFPIVRP